MTTMTSRRLPAWTRALGLALVVMMLLGVALAAPARLRAETPAAANANELLVFDWNKPVTKNYSGFAQYKPLKSYPNMPNGNWVSPINYTGGTLYFRVKVLSIPVNQPAMKLGFCFWQLNPKYGEECTKNYSVPGIPGTERIYSQSFRSMAKIHGAAINWTQPRWKEGFVVRGPRGEDRLEVRAAFILIGGEPLTAGVEDWLRTDARGYFLTGPDLRQPGGGPAWPLVREPLFLESSQPGLFVAGDVRHGSVKRVASAVGEGAMAIALVHRHLAKAAEGGRPSRDGAAPP